jgi:hypothetical protein
LTQLIKTCNHTPESRMHSDPAFIDGFSLA